MQSSVGVVLGAVIVSVALLILYRRELVTAGTGMNTNGVYRLDRWTGSIVACAQRNSPRIVWTANRRNEPALFLDELDAFIAQGGEKSFDILRLKKVGWDQVIQLIERDAAGRTRDLHCPSNCFRQFHLALLEMGFPLKGRAPPERREREAGTGKRGPELTIAPRCPN